MSIKLDKREVEKVDIYLGMIRQYNAEMQEVIQNDEEIQNLIKNNEDFQRLDFTVQKTNQSLKAYIDTVINDHNGQSSSSDRYVLDVDTYTLELIPEEENTSDTTVEDDGGSSNSSEKVDDSGVIEV
jgi:hypothetical protein|tara:strand:+ start:1447 stop:1827 length:381 start_codon:yes stop_codon:yes gene_type:complete